MDLITIDRLDGWNKSKVNEEEEDFLFSMGMSNHFFFNLEYFSKIVD